MDENVTNAVVSLSQDLLISAESYDNNESSPFLYSTTIGVIVLIHVIYALQLKRPRRNFVTSYQQIVGKKQFYKLVLAMLSHPNPNLVDTVQSNSNNNNRRRITSLLFDSNYTGSTANSRMRRLDIDFGDIYTGSYDSSHQAISSWNHRLTLIGITIWYFLRDQIIHPFVFGQYAGLPLLCYVSHILWQCRSLEEVYDYNFDRNFPSIHNDNFNVTSIISRDMLVRNALRANDVAKKPISKHTKMGYNLEYYRVLFALLFCSYLIDILITHLTLRYFKRLQGQTTTDSDLESLSVPSQLSPPSSSYSFGHTNGFLESLANRNIGTLTPLASALLVIYSSHFPYTPISILPFVGTRLIFGSSSQITFIISYLILFMLSYRIYPFAGVFCGSVTGLFWTSDLITFLADCYWGGWCICIAILVCAASLKVEMRRPIQTMHHDHQGFNCRYQFRDWLSWIDYVNWPT